MMSSRVLSRLLPVAEGDVSIYEGLRRDASRLHDLEAQDEPPTQKPFRDDDSDPDGMLYDEQLEERVPQFVPDSPQAVKRRTDEDEDVPESLLLEPKRRAHGDRAPRSRSRTRREAQWQTAQRMHGLENAQTTTKPRRGSTKSRSNAAVVAPAQADPKAAAMWIFTNAHNLDAFLGEVYDYYVGHGFWSILLSRIISLLNELFVFSFAMFLTTCIDWKKLPQSKSTAEILIPKCMATAPWWKNVAIFIFVIYWCSRFATYAGGLRRLSQLRDFYQHVLGIPDSDIQTVSWVRVVNGLTKLHNANIATADPSLRKYTNYNRPRQRMDAEAIANRLMRRDNYYVALYNKDIIDFTLPIPFLGQRQFYSKSLEWCIDFCFTNFIFDEQGNIRPFCLEIRNRKVLVEALQMRLQFTALTSVLVAPFNIIRFCIMYFFRYYTEFTRNPSKASVRSFTPFAEWKIREFNELDHLFQRRLRSAYQPANNYLRQFPKDKLDQICRFVAFISGAIAAVLALATLLDAELFLGFEVTPGRTAVFWLTVLIGVFTVAHASLPEDDEVFDPVMHLKAVLYCTHYVPSHWKDRLHTAEVRSEFSAMYQTKILIFVEEILSLVVAPLILLRNASRRSERIIDFFREQTVHQEDMGYQCNFAVFGLQKNIHAADPTTVLDQPDGLRDEYFGLKDDKMAASMHGFMQFYSPYRLGSKKADWHPPPPWPRALSPSTIAEQGAAAAAKNTSTPRAAKLRRSGVHDSTSLSIQSPRQLAQAGFGRSNPSQRQAEKRSALPSSPPSMPTVSESVVMRDDSDLQDVNRSGQELSESDGGADGEEDALGRAGVLGMLQQFAKAQTERGAGVAI